MPAGKVTETVVRKVKNAVESRGIVVWYDPEGVYGRCVREEALWDLPILLLEDGFFRLRKELEPFLEYVTPEGLLKEDADQPPRVVVYVPKQRQECRWALVEAETAGCWMDPGSTVPERNTRLSGFVQSVFGEIAPARVDTLVRQADEGILTLEELDRIAGETTGPASAALHLVFGNASLEEILLSFACSDGYDEAISAKKAERELETLLKSETGLVTESRIGLPELRQALERHLLMGDFLLGLGEGAIPEGLEKVPLPEKPMQRDLVRHLCNLWRNRLDLKEAYKTAAGRVQKAFCLENQEMAVDGLEKIETFPVIDHRLVAHAASLVLDGHFEEAKSMAQGRLSLFWAREEPETGLAWSVLESAAALCLEAERVGGELKKGPAGLEDFVQAYTGHSQPWLRLDRCARQLETRYARLETLDEGTGQVEPAVNRARFRYNEILHAMAGSYAQAASRSEFRGKKVLPQAETFQRRIKPLLEKNEKAAYFLVDALRFEMAFEMAEGFGKENDVRLEPVLGQLPGITAVGMAALMPRAESGLELEEKGGKLSVSVQGNPVSSRNARMEWIRKTSGVPTAVFKLGEVVRLTPKRKREIEDASLIVVTSQEIDRLGEDASDEEETRTYMDDVLEKIRRAVRSLSRAGIRRFFITADHGFQMPGLEEPGLSMDSPGGQTVELHPRVWIGKGGKAGDSFLRCRAGDLELGGDLELAFPKGIGTFKLPGGAGRFCHGGLSPQEHILPLLSLEVKGPVAGTGSGLKVSISLAKDRITNRIFMATLEAKADGLFPTDEKRVRVEIVSGKEECGAAVAASQGFDEASREMTVSLAKPTSVTLMLGSGDIPEKVSLQVVDPETQVVLDVMKDIPVELVI